jgi:hypothetical protein
MHILKVEASFYSVANSCFEPLLEPLKVTVDVDVC